MTVLGRWRRTARRAAPHWIAALAVICSLLVAGPAHGQVAESAPGQDKFQDQPFASSPTAAGETATAASGPSATRIVVSLGAVAILIVGLGWVYRRVFTAQQHKGGGAVKLLSRSMLTPRHQVLVMRLGHRLLVVGDSGHGMNLLCEITDPAEITAVLGESTDEADLRDLRAGAFSSSLDEASAGYEMEIPDGDSEAIEDAPELDLAQGEVRSLIERVRTLSGHLGGPTGTGPRTE